MHKECRHKILSEHFGVFAKPNQVIVALAGNPNVGKSTVFNALTGLRQHTGNWPGKTVDNAQGSFSIKDKNFLLIDLPGTYSLFAHTIEEEIARDFICFGQPDVTLIVLDATSLERNLNLALQIMEVTSNIVVCINLIDEARKKKIIIDFPALEAELGVPVVATAARLGIGLKELKNVIYKLASGEIKPTPYRVSYSEEIEQAISQLLPHIDNLDVEKLFAPRWLALRLLDGDENFLKKISLHMDMYYSQRHTWEVELAL
jgi:Fe2+ transport system protein B